MTRKQRRSFFIAVALVVLGSAVGLVLFALQDSIVFFYSPSDVASKQIKVGTRFRLGGLVEDKSFKRLDGTKVQFVITDTDKVMRVTYEGVLPDLFREGQGVITEGTLAADGSFTADSVLAKHDETYMPPEVAATLKEKGYWQGKDGESKKQ